MTRLEVLTLPYHSVTQKLDDEALIKLQQNFEIINQQSYLVGPPHALVLLLMVRPIKSKNSDVVPSRHSVTYVPENSSHPKTNSKSSRKKRDDDLEAAKHALSQDELKAFEGLRVWRNSEAIHLGIPSFEICSNQALIEIVTRKPQTFTALKAIQGFGEKRIKRFGEAILKQCIAQKLIPNPTQDKE